MDMIFLMILFDVFMISANSTRGFSMKTWGDSNLGEEFSDRFFGCLTFGGGGFASFGSGFCFCGGLGIVALPRLYSEGHP